MSQLDDYLATIERLEPDIAMIDAGAAYASMSISLKRIADALQKPQSEARISALTEARRIAQRVINEWGEEHGDDRGVTAAKMVRDRIQSLIERGVP